MIDDRVRRVMSDVLDLDPAAIDERTAMGSVDTWDSLRHINLCLALEQEFSLSLSVPEIESMLSYPAILRVLAARPETRS